MSADDINIVTNILNNDENRRLIAATTQEASTDYSSTCNENSSSEKESYGSATSPIGTVSPNADTFHTTREYDNDSLDANYNNLPILTDENPLPPQVKNTNTKNNFFPTHIKIFQPSEPVIIQAAPNCCKLHGLPDHFSEELPQALSGKVSNDEFRITMSKINSLLLKRTRHQSRLLMLGLVLCGCSCGASFLPSAYSAEDTIERLKSLLDQENARIYQSQLSLKWSLMMRPILRFIEYTIVVEFVPRYNFTLPD